MLIIPAIDIKDGEVVRYTRGKGEKKVYSSDPLSVALNWQRQGARFLHIVDLDGAMTQDFKNLHIIAQILKAVKIPVEIGGGLRTQGAVEKFIKMGANRVIVGTKAIETRGFLKGIIRRFGDKIAVGLDLSGRSIGVYGWKKSLNNIQLKDLLEAFEALHLKTLIYTDIRRDGTLKGVNISGIKRVLSASTIDIIVSGGVSSLDDIKKLLRLSCDRIKGVIVGKALYERRFSLKEAMAVVSVP